MSNHQNHHAQLMKHLNHQVLQDAAKALTIVVAVLHAAVEAAQAEADLLQVVHQKEAAVSNQH